MFWWGEGEGRLKVGDGEWETGDGRWMYLQHG